MIIDSSAILAILLNEDDALQLIKKIEEDFSPKISAANFLEISIVLEAKFGRAGIQKLDYFIERAAIEIVSVTEKISLIAREASFKYGKGKHKAKLNYGDCFAYATAKYYTEPLLFKGNDFIHTDIA